MLNNYSNPAHPLGFGGKSKLLANVKDPKATEQALRSVRSYTLHAPIRKHYPTRRIFVKTLMEQWEIDLVDMSAFSKVNDGFKFLLTCIDDFSKRSDAEPMHNKTPIEAVKAFERIIERGLVSGQKRFTTPQIVRSDAGSEFLGRNFQRFLSNNEITHSVATNVVKASIVERFNRTLKTRMFKYFTHVGSHRYIEVLPKLLSSYNNRYHRSIKMKPNSVTFDNQHIVFENLYPKSIDAERRRPKLLSPGDTVRISRAKHVFSKGYDPNFSEEIFTIVRRIKPTRTFPNEPFLYALADSLGQRITGTFYPQELLAVNPQRSHLIERVLRRSGKKVLVRWLGYPKAFDSWILANAIE